MLLFRYLASHALETLQEAKLKTSRISNFNDPFEFRFKTINELNRKNARQRIAAIVAKRPNFISEIRIPNIHTFADIERANRVDQFVNQYRLCRKQTLSEMIEQVDRTIRVTCFSHAKVKPIKEILMWSHYANKHHGLRIGFEFPQTLGRSFQIIKIKYQKERVTVDMAALHKTGVETAMRKCLRVKSTAWSYEREHRLLTRPCLCEERSLEDQPTECFVDFQRSWVKFVDFGVRCSIEIEQQIIDLLKAKYPHTVCRKAEFNKSEFALNYRAISNS